MESAASVAYRGDGLTDTRPQRIVSVVGPGPRLGAAVIDTVLVSVFSMIVAIAAGLVGELIGMYSANGQAWGAFFTAASGLGFSLCYYVASWVNGGQTLGATLLSFKVVTADGRPVSLGRAILRYIGFIASALALSIGFIWIAFDKKRQGWHDKVAGTVVIPSQQFFSGGERIVFVPTGGGPMWIVAWVILAVLAPGALTAGVLALGPFVDMAIKALAGR